MQPARTRRLQGACQFQSLEFPSNSLRELHDARERNVLAWIEVNRTVVGELDSRQARLPRMYGDRSELYRVQQCKQITSDESLRQRSIFNCHLGDANPGRMTTRILLAEGLSSNPVRVTLQYQRSIADQREKHRRDERVIPHHVSFGDPRLLEEHFLEAGDVQRLPSTEAYCAVAAFALELPKLREH